MKKAWKEEAVSPVIATILMVAITVVLSAVLYVMVISMGTSVDNAVPPLGLYQQKRNQTAISLLVSYAPNGAFVYQSSLSIEHEGIPQPVTATLYYGNGSIVSTYVNDNWLNLPNDRIEFTNGMILLVSAAEIKHGDIFKIHGLGFGVSLWHVD